MASIKHNSDRYKSRRKTPWDGAEKLTPTQAFITHQYEEHYMQRHPKLEDTGEVELINSFSPTKCPHCGTANKLFIFYVNTISYQHAN